MPSTPHGVKSRPQVTGVMIGRMISAFGADDVVGPRLKFRKLRFQLIADTLPWTPAWRAQIVVQIHIWMENNGNTANSPLSSCVTTNGENPGLLIEFTDNLAGAPPYPVDRVRRQSGAAESGCRAPSADMMSRGSLRTGVYPTAGV